MTKAISSSLRGTATKWFFTLQKASISDWDVLTNRFYKTFYFFGPVYTCRHPILLQLKIYVFPFFAKNLKKLKTWKYSKKKKKKSKNKNDKIIIK